MTDSHNPFLRRASLRGTTGHGNLSEKRIATKLGARQTPASGAIKSAKGDMVLLQEGKNFRIESKATEKLVLPLDYGWLSKIWNEAVATNCRPALTLSFVTADGRQRERGDWIAIPMSEFQEMLDDLKILRAKLNEVSSEG